MTTTDRAGVHLKQFEATTGIVFNIYVEPTGWFRAYLPGEEHAADGALTLDGLEGKLKASAQRAAKATRKKVAIPVLRVNGNSVEEGIAYGLHAGTGNVLVDWANSGKEQVSSFYSTKLLDTSMSAEARATYAATGARLAEARRRLDEMELQFAFRGDMRDVKRQVLRAIGEA